MMKHVLDAACGWSARGIVVLVMGLLLTGFVTVQSADSAKAAPDVPNDPVTLVIQKFEQPHQPGDPATGLPLQNADLAAMKPVSDVEFAVTKVPDIDVTTNQGRRAAEALDVSQAIERTVEADPKRTGRTNEQGKLIMGKLATGVYLVEETTTPSGVVPTDPFLVMLPMQHPNASGWLDTVHVYPKNSPVEVNLAVVDQHTVQTGYDITWKISASIPQLTSIDRYRIVNTLASGLTLGQALSDIQVALSTGTLLVLDTDYTIETHTAGGRAGFVLSLTTAGRDKVVQARENTPGVELQVTYDAPATTSGEHTSEVTLTVDDAQAVTDTATTKFGDLRVVIHEQNDPHNRIPGAVFELYLSPEDALRGNNPLTIAGVNRWTTDANGTLRIDGLRLSGFVNGLDRDRSDQLFRSYYLKPVSFPKGWTGSTEPIAVTLTSALEVYELVLELQRLEHTQSPTPGDDQAATPDDDEDHQAGVFPPDDSPGTEGLASTGARIAGLILFALALITAGLYALRNRQTHDSVTS